uniref:NADH dehydrogenase subunit 3 n=1 Tax=Xylophaga dorsalis TaxID=1526741 RepID=UPI0020287474|nr:NADH dehydrogenase subunit 3 [Xylophaga dorsalis]UPX88883.1 NADH dehydrogenase subunit 3 [Xylophaga dorsalis]
MFDSFFEFLMTSFSYWIMFFFCLLVPTGFMGIWFIMSDKTGFNYWDKKTSFECGFDCLSSSWLPFSLRFYILALLFMVVDVEIILFFCFVFSKGLYVFSFSYFMKFWLSIFLFLLGGALFHEYNEGSLDWK